PFPIAYSTFFSAAAFHAYAGSAIFFLVFFLAAQIIFVFADLVPSFFEDGGGFGFDLIDLAFLDRAVFVVFAAAFVIRVAPRTGIAHLDEFAGHVHADEIILLAVFLEHLGNLVARFLGDFRCLEAPMG